MVIAQHVLPKKLELPAIRQRDLGEVLDQYGLGEGLRKLNLNCASCDRQLTEDNIGALLTQDGGLSLYCRSQDCIEDASLHCG